MMIEQQINITKQRSVFSTIPHIEWKMQFGLKSVMSEFHAWNWKTTIVWKTIPPTSMNVIDRRAKNVHTKAIFKCPTTDSQQMQTMKRFNDVKHNVEWSEKQKHLHWIQNLRLFPCQNDWFYTHTEREIEAFTCHVSYTSVPLSVCFVCFVWLWIAFEQAENGNEFVRKNRSVFVSFTHGPFIV